MGKNVQGAIKEMETFASDFEYLLSLAAIMSAYEHLQENQDFKGLEAIYYSLKKMGVSRTKFIDLLEEKLNNGELKIPSNFYGNCNSKVAATSLVNHYFTNLNKYNSNREMAANYYIKGSEELMKLISSSKTSDIKSQNRGIKGLFSRKETDNSQNDEIERLIAEKQSEVNNDKRLYDEANAIVEFLLDIQKMYPQYITLLSIEKQLWNLYSEKDISWSFSNGYDAVKKNPDRILKQMQEKIQSMSIPTGALLEQNSRLKHFVGKVNDMLDYFKISIKSSQLISFDEFLTNPEFVEYINSIVEHINAIVKKEESKKSKR